MQLKVCSETITSAANAVSAKHKVSPLTKKICLNVFRECRGSNAQSWRISPFLSVF
jgi:hypothetical protein